MQRKYQPSLIAALTGEFASSITDRPFRRFEIQIYRVDQPGAYVIKETGKLYWMDDVGGQFWENTSQDALFENLTNLGEVVIVFDNGRERKLVGKCIEEYFEKLDLE